MDKWSIIRGLADELGVSPEAFKKWRQRGIPPRWIFPLLTTARRQGADLSEGDLAEMVAGSLSTTSESRVA